MCPPAVREPSPFERRPPPSFGGGRLLVQEGAHMLMADQNSCTIPASLSDRCPSSPRGNQGQRSAALVPRGCCRRTPGGFGRFCARGRWPALVGDDTGCDTALHRPYDHHAFHEDAAVEVVTGDPRLSIEERYRCLYSLAGGAWRPSSHHRVGKGPPPRFRPSPSRLSCYNKAPQGPKALRSLLLYQVGLGRLELPTSRLSDISRALVSARQRWPVMIQVVLQLP